jgi:hypothetical protein
VSLDCTYSVTPLQILAYAASADACPPRAEAAIEPLAPWNAVGRDKPVTVDVSRVGIATDPQDKKRVVCTYQSSGTEAFQTYSYIPTGTSCQYGVGFSWVCTMP